MTDVFSGRVLYVEDEPLIAMETEDVLRDLGFSKIDMHHTFDRAMTALDESEYDLAIMDMNLNGTLSSPLIERLTERKTPIVVTTGYNAAQDMAGIAFVTVRKPFSGEQLKTAIERARG
ncbi:MAG: response regulator [Pseudomonadota bacterium]